MKRSRLVLLGLVMVAAVISGGWLLQRGSSRSQAVFEKARLFEDIVAHIAEYAIDSLEEAELYELAIEGLIEELNDPYATYLGCELKHLFILDGIADRGGLFTVRFFFLLGTLGFASNVVLIAIGSSKLPWFKNHRWMLIIGLSFGVVLAIRSTTPIHEALEKNGEYMYTRKRVLCIILSTIGALLILFYFATTSAENGYLIINSLLIGGVVANAVGLFYDFHWEKKHQKIIMVRSPYRVYAVQKQKESICHV